MPSEVQSYRLSYRGKPAGTHTLTTFHQNGISYMEGRMHLQGALRQSTVQQRSRFDRERFFSLHFEETNEARGDNRTFVVELDSSRGLIRARKGQEKVELPYVTPYRDPLSMLQELRAREGKSEALRIPMLGKDVTATLVGDTTLESPQGERLAHTFLLRPGGSYVYLDARPPHLILKLVQRLDDAYLEAQLVRVVQEDGPPDWTTQAPQKRKRPRRRRGRRRRNQSK